MTGLNIYVRPQSRTDISKQQAAAQLSEGISRASCGCQHLGAVSTGSEVTEPEAYVRRLRLHVLVVVVVVHLCQTRSYAFGC